MNKDAIPKKAVSNAEWTLEAAWKYTGILDGSFQNDDFPFTPEICKKYNTKIRGTNIDRHYPGERYAIFFDGPHHTKLQQEQTDAMIDKILKNEFHYIVRRYKFHTMTKGRAMQIAQEVRVTLELFGYKVSEAKQAIVLQCGFCDDEDIEKLFVDDGDFDARSELIEHMIKIHCMPQIKVV